jgi:membrane-associated protease RseP (regulator of RpoE activity)
MSKRLSILLSVAGVALAVATNSFGQTDRGPRAPQTPPPRDASVVRPGEPAATSGGQAYLGIAYEAIPRAIESQLAAAFPDIGKGAGVIIVHVAPDSPAAKAGLKPYDIVTALDDQPVNSADQFMGIINRAEAGRDVTLKIVRASKSQDVKATLGQRSGEIVRGQAPSEESRRASGVQAEDAENEIVESFDSLSLTRTGKDEFKAMVKFRDRAGNIVSRDFQGTSEAIRRDILAQKDLPTSERHQLLGALRFPMEAWGDAGSGAEPSQRGNR